MAVGKKIFEPDEIRKTIQALKDYEELFEVRFLEANGKRVSSGRPSGVSSTDEQLNQAKIVGNKVYVFMKNLGFNEPITAMSGNGIHLLYKIRLRNSDENKALIKNCLLVLDMLFSNDCVDIDKTNFNPARICKLYGTVARKGSNTAENPHRMSRLLSEQGTYR